MRLLVRLMILFALVLAAGCQPESGENPLQPQITATATNPQPAVITPTAPDPATGTPGRSPTRLLERIPPIETSIPVTGEVPQTILDPILSDLAQRAAVSRDQIDVIRAEATVWNDGSLGCAQPGQFYTQALVNGYWAVLEVDGKAYDYRVADSGYFFLCENAGRPIRPAGTPDA